MQCSKDLEMNERDWAKATYPPSPLSISGCANSRSGQVLDPSDKSFDDGLGLLGDQGVARVRNDRYCDARTELVFHFVALGLRLERVVRGLQLQERRRAAGPPLVLLDRGDRGALAVADFKVPALQPDGRIVARKNAKCNAARRSSSESERLPALGTVAASSGGYCLAGPAAITTPRTRAG